MLKKIKSISKITGITLLMFLFLAAIPVSAEFDDDECMMCHGDKDALEVEDQAKLKKLLVDYSRFELTVHSADGCISCHMDIEDLPHKEKLDKVDCTMCHDDAMDEINKSAHALENGARCVDCHGYHYVASSTEANSTLSPVNQVETCGACHSQRIPTGSGYKIRAVTDLYKHNAHFEAIKEGKVAPSCTDCHGNHNIKTAKTRREEGHTDASMTLCADCHSGVFEEYADSVHGAAYLRGIQDAVPNCIYCHGSHLVLGKDKKNSPTSRENVDTAICGPCHSSEALHQRFDLDTDKMATYENSFHGLARRYSKDADTAVCTDCHGVHGIRSADDEKSMISQKNLPKTCGQCHDDLSPEFLAGKIHTTTEITGSEAAEIIKIIYIILIFVVIGGMFLHNLFDYARKIQLRLRKQKEQPYVIRWKPQETVQHWILLITFIVLAITGFMLKFPSAFWVQPLKWIGINFAVRGIIHRVAAVLFIMLSIYHTYYLLLTKRGREQFVQILPKWKDVTDFIHMAMFYLGIKKDMPEFERYNYAEKAEYLALLWGSVMMILTGLVLWFKDWAAELMPKWGYDIAEVIHYYEAWLATLAIIVWHLYHVLVNPSAKPINLSMFHGRMTEEEMEHEHPIELERVKELGLMVKPKKAKTTEKKTTAKKKPKKKK